MARTSSRTVQSVRTSRRITATSSRAISRQHAFALHLDGGLVLRHGVVERQLVRSSAAGVNCAPRLPSAATSRASSTSSAMTSAEVSCWLVYLLHQLGDPLRERPLPDQVVAGRLGRFLGDELAQRLDGQLRVPRLLRLGDELGRQVVQRRLRHAGGLVDVQDLAGRRRGRDQRCPAVAGSPPAPARRVACRSAASNLAM